MSRCYILCGREQCSITINGSLNQPLTLTELEEP